MADDLNPSDDRREFLKKCGKFVVVTPPAVTALLSTSLTSEALAYSSGGRSTPPGWSMGRKNGWSDFFSAPPKKSAAVKKAKSAASKGPKIAARSGGKHK